MYTIVASPRQRRGPCVGVPTRLGVGASLKRGGRRRGAASNSHAPRPRERKQPGLLSLSFVMVGHQHGHALRYLGLLGLLGFGLVACASAPSELRPARNLVYEAQTVEWLRDLVDVERGPAALRQLARRVAPDFQLSRRGGDLDYARVQQLSGSTSHWAAVGLDLAGEPATFRGWDGPGGGVQGPDFEHAHAAVLLLNETGTPVWLLEHEELIVDIIDADGDGLREEALVRSNRADDARPMLAIYDLRETPPTPMFAVQFELGSANEGAAATLPGAAVSLPTGGRWRFDACTPESQSIVIEASEAGQHKIIARYDFIPSQRIFAAPGAELPARISEIQPSPWLRLHPRGPYETYRGRNDPQLGKAAPDDRFDARNLTIRDLH